MVETIDISKDKAAQFEEMKKYGEGFLDCVCSDCEEKCMHYLKKHVYLLPFPNIWGKKLLVLMCKDCKAKVVNKLKR